MPIFRALYQVDILSEICRDIAQIFFASFVVLPFVSGPVINKWVVVTSGLIISILFWFISLYIMREDS